MTSNEPQPQPRRRKSMLADDDMWSVPAAPPTPATAPAPAAAPAPPPAPAVPTPAPTPPFASPPPTGPARAEEDSAPSRAGARPRVRESRGHARDLAEARGRKKVRDAAYAWAVAAQRTTDRLEELRDEVAAARGRGTDPAVLDGFLAEACDRYGLDPAQLPPDLRLGRPADA